MEGYPKVNSSENTKEKHPPHQPESDSRSESTPVQILTDERPRLLEGFREILQYRELLFMLVRRDIKARYKQAFLGIAWAVFSPLGMMIIFTLVFSRIPFAMASDIPYPIYVYTGLLPWMFFQGSVADGTQSLVANFSLVTKIYFPREVFPLSALLTKLVDLGLATLILAALMFYYGFSPQWTTLLVPVLLLVQIIFTFGLILFLSVGNLLFRDVRKIIDVALLLGMFASNVIFPLNFGGLPGRMLPYVNPLINIIDGYRDLILRGKLPPAEPLAYTVLIGVFLLLGGAIFFHRMEPAFAEKI